MGKALLFSSQKIVDYNSISLNEFFFMILSKIIFVDCIGENNVVFLKKHCQLLVQFLSFFLSIISSIIPLVSITYLVLIHNYNIIKYIYFINS